MSWLVGPVKHPEELGEILALQRENHVSAVARDVAVTEGFVTASHTLDVLEKMHAMGPSIVARDADGTLAGYALMMALEARALVAELVPMFALFDGLEFRGRPLRELRYYVMGQVCVAKPYRGKGVFDALYAGHRAEYGDRFDLTVTEIATRNGRSLRAHERVGFESIHRYRDATDEWAIVGWDFTVPDGR